MVILFNKPYGVLSQFTPEGGHPALTLSDFHPMFTLPVAWTTTAKVRFC